MLVWIGDALCLVDEPRGVPLFWNPGTDSVIQGDYPDGPLPVADEPPTGSP